MPPGIRLHFAFLRYWEDQFAACTDERSDLALAREHCSAVVALLLGIRVGVIAG
jgi:hypothetical protein